MDPEYLWKCHMEERRINRPFASVIRQMPTYTVWDDHDFGPNNSDGLEPGKEGSLRAFQAVFAQSIFHGSGFSPPSSNGASTESSTYRGTCTGATC